jgi:hypothetical protein
MPIMVLEYTLMGKTFVDNCTIQKKNINVSCFLSRKAVDEIMREARLGAARADVSGPSGWKKCTVMKTNKRFLTNTLVQHINSNRIREKRKSNTAKNSRPERERSPSSDQDSDRRSRKHSNKGEGRRKDSASKSEIFRDSKVSKEKKKKRKHSKDKDSSKRKKHKSKHRER